MYPLLILREEIVCLIILVFLWLNGRFYQMGKDHGSFLRMCVYAVGHVVFDIVTVLTVNNVEAVPLWANYAAHIVFYMFAILFSQEFFCYTIELCFPKQVLQKVRRWSLLPLALYLLALPLLPIEYLEGTGTKYSLGMAAFVGYAVAMLFFVSSAVIVTIFYKRMAPHVRTALIPMLVVMVAAEVIQIAVPELLFTGGVATIVAVSFFFSLENPAHVFKQKLLVDALTGVKSRHSYEIDIQEMDREYQAQTGHTYGMVFCDINNLKAVNDNQGHLEGDAYIGAVAQILTADMSQAEGVYRMGGDEFLAIYRDVGEADIRRDVDQVLAHCDQQSKTLPYQMSIAIGYAVSGAQYASLADVLRVADYIMYKNKAEMKKRVAFVSEDGEKLNLTGLTDRIFDAFAATGDRNYLTLCNMSTNVSRWSKSAVEYFDLPGEFVFDCITLWMDLIHPDDQADYWADISEVFAGHKKYHDIEYRVRNRRGEYVMVTCRGTILKGKNGEPDMFAATLVNHGIAESIDPVTGLHNEQSLIRHAEDLLGHGTPTAFLLLGICTFSRINLLYGYANGNRILRQFVEIAKRIINGRGRIFREDGTKFVVCIPKGTAKDLMELHKDLQDAVYREIKLDGLVIPLRLAAGAFVADKAMETTTPAVRNHLTRALERSKQEFHGRLVFSGDPVLEDTMDGDYRLLAAIHQDAVADKKGFYLRYQPILSMDTQEILGAEALLRWSHPSYGEVGPSRFVPWLENDPCFYQLGRWILQTALEEALEMVRIDPKFVVNVNVTVLQLEDERFNTMVLEALQNSGFPPSRLCLELTERCRELDFDFLRMEIDFFHSHGVQVALDDVGTGFSSLGVLLKLPVDEIKLDMSFITGIRSLKTNQIFVQAIVDAANRMGYHSCLEGVEDRDTYEFLRQFGATSFQGYYHSRPLPADEMVQLLKNPHPPGEHEGKPPSMQA